MTEREKYILLDGKLLSENEVNHKALAAYDMYYEVVRVVNGKVAFLTDHVERIKKSLNLAGVTKNISFKSISSNIKKCIRANSLENGNIRFSAFSDGKYLKWLFEVIPHHYPSALDYENGVSAAVVKFQRERPNIKKWNQKMKEVVKRYKNIKNVYEILFYDDDGYLTEGSQSNLFFIVNEKVFTAPGDEVLKGITRKYVIESILESGFELCENSVHVFDLLKYDAAFITGTSPKVLPLNEIKACCHADPKHPVLRKIMEAYDNKLNENIT